MVGDPDEDVRIELARKIGRLLAGLLQNELHRLSVFTLTTLERLAGDELPRVRGLLAEEIKGLHSVPKQIINWLARDVETTVAVPILEYSPLLSDADLIEIIAAASAECVIAAVARRRDVSEDVSEAIVATLDIPAVATLLANPSAKIREKTMQTITTNAATTEAWHTPLVMRAELSVRVMRRIAGFVSTGLLEQLQQRSGLDDATRAFLQRRMRAHLKSESRRPPSPVAQFMRVEVMKRYNLGCLDDNFVVQAARADSR